MKILNLYAGIGGNRLPWGDEHEITAVEYKPEIAQIYSDHFPNDKVIVADAHDFLLEHYHEYDFIWSSPPCPTHSRIRKGNLLDPYKDNSVQIANGGGAPPAYPNMVLYQEIIFLQHHFRGKYCIENVIAYYEPLIQPLEMANHWFWTNFYIQPMKFENGRDHMGTIKTLEERKGFDLSKYKGIDKRMILRNCVESEVSQYILEQAQSFSPSLFTNPL